MKKRKLSDLEYCDSDYKNRHFWERVGVDNGYVYSRCFQCRKWKREKIVFVKKGE